MSDLSTRLVDGEIVCGVGASTFAPAVIEVYGSLGLDYVWLDLEHKGPSPGDSQQLEHLVRAAEAADIELLARLPSAEPWLVRKVLDTGISNLIIARVETATEVRHAARAATVALDGEPGERGVGISRTSDWGTDDYEPANDDPGVGVMFETAAAIDNLSEILAVPGLDFVYPGAADLAVSWAIPSRRTTLPCRKCSPPSSTSVSMRVFRWVEHSRHLTMWRAQSTTVGDSSGSATKHQSIPHYTPPLRSLA